MFRKTFAWSEKLEVFYGFCVSLASIILEKRGIAKCHILGRNSVGSSEKRGNEACGLGDVEEANRVTAQDSNRDVGK